MSAWISGRGVICGRTVTTDSRQGLSVMKNISSVRARYAETDQMGVVYYANFYVWMEIGRTNLLRDMGLTYKEMESRGVMLPIAESHARYYAPAFYDDEITIESEMTEFRAGRIKLSHKILGPSGRLLCEGYTVHAFMDAASRRVIRAPEFFRKIAGPYCPAQGGL